MNDLKNKKLLIVDDEFEIRNMLHGFLRKNGFNRIYEASNCSEALKIFYEISPDIAVLDIMLPDGDGFSLLSTIRKTSSIPVVFLSAKGEDEDRLLGLGLGADDYIVKPFLPRELVLRLTSILRRVYSPIVQEKKPIFELGNHKIDLESGIVSYDDKECPFTAKELILLNKFYENKNRIVTNDALCQVTWGDDYYGYENTLAVHIRRIREKIESNPSDPKYLVTVRGLGYKLLIKENS
ncbi:MULTISPECIES: response regulator transcription factor [Clostridium]|uniref:Stage 0 sporulation protein A homolog n=1 Tax=Clostridium intestinale DSM 6191 TaxID=1121320 RepID=A0A1M5ZQ92_9CLOT|nr:MULTISPECIES: response regulator transcription factor [Clostridium]SHI26372.1 DNA-binding response regulator, OmpR family, contains REC and winged-helix (wHTH) domain [Clostridium intestinale DSM 6191]